MAEKYKKKDGKGYVVYTGLFAIAGFMAFAFFIILGKSLVYNVDAIYQHYPLLINLRHMAGALIRGEGFSFWSQNIGLGSDTLGNLAIVMMDPFNYIAAAFPVKYMDIGYSLAVIFRIYTAGLSMMAFLRYKKFSRKGCIIGGVSYAFCSWSLGVIYHPFFLNPLILFPLVILGIDKVLDGEKPYTLIFSVVASLITYLYFAYMTAIFSFIYICIRYFWGKINTEKTAKDFLKRMGIFIVLVLVAGCVAAPVIFSTAYVLFNTMKTSGMDVQFWPSFMSLLRTLPNLVDGTELFGHYSMSCVNGLTVLMMPVMIFQFKDRKKRVPVILFLFCFLMLQIPGWNSFMNGFSYSVGRWCYILEFFFVWAAIMCLEECGQQLKEHKKIIIGWLILLMLSMVVANVFFSAESILSMVQGFITLCFAFFFWMDILFNGAERIYLLLVLNIGVTYLVHFSPFGGNAAANFCDVGHSYDLYQKSLMKAESSIKDDDFWRLDYGEHLSLGGDRLSYLLTPLNESLFWGGRTLSCYLSSLDGKQLEYNKMLLNCCGYYRRVCVYSNDNRSRMNFLQGVRYYLHTQEEKNTESRAGYGFSKSQEAKDVIVEKSRYDVGLGYVFSETMSENDFREYSALDKEQVLMQAVVLDEKDIQELDLEQIKEKNLVLDTAEVPYQISEDSPITPIGEFEVESVGQTAALTIPECENVELYVKFENLQRIPYTYEEQRELDGINETSSKAARIKYDINHMNYQPYTDFELHVIKGDTSKKIIYRGGEPQGLTDTHDFLVNLGYYDRVDGNVTIYFNNAAKYHCDDIKVYAVSQQHFDEQAEKLEKNRFHMTSCGANEMEGEVFAEKRGILYLSLLYHPGWKVYVDGEQVKTYRTDICFTGVPISEGQHQVTLVYRPVGFTVSLILFAAGVAVIVGLIVYYRMREKKR